MLHVVRHIECIGVGVQRYTRFLFQCYCAKVGGEDKLWGAGDRLGCRQKGMGNKCGVDISL
jgi:hypothetical protein